MPIRFKHQIVPDHITEGHHSQYIIPVARKICKGVGLDIGCNRPEWSFPGSRPIDITLPDDYDAYNLPEWTGGYDYIFSSHCLEHLEDYRGALQHWLSHIKSRGKLFLYLPHPDCLYWHPNEQPTKLHLHSFTPMIIKELLEDLGLVDIFFSERDLAYSFAVYGSTP